MNLQRPNPLPLREPEPRPGTSQDCQQGQGKLPLRPFSLKDAEDAGENAEGAGEDAEDAGENAPWEATPIPQSSRAAGGGEVNSHVILAYICTPHLI